jgi:hypothetical protein
MKASLKASLKEISEKLTAQLVGEGDINSVLVRGEVTHCAPLSDTCFGWIRLNSETAIGFKAGRDFLEVYRNGARRVIFSGELQGKPAEIIVGYWMVS